MRDTLLKLAERCEAATGADRELDAAIAAVVRLERVPDWARIWSGEWRPTDQGSVVLMQGDGTPGPHFMAREYSASLDAAMTLVPEGWDGAIYLPTQGSKTIVQLENQAMRDMFLVNGTIDGEAATPALALCAAALRARAALQETSDGE